MALRLSTTATAEVAHSLPTHPIGENRRLHGHSLLVTVTVEGEKGSGGMVLDFAFFKARVQAIVKLLDHQHLNEAFPEIDPPTLENVAEWLGRAIGALDQPCRLLSVKVERPTCNEAAEWLP